jgi:hypothetical protein
MLETPLLLAKLAQIIGNTILHFQPATHCDTVLQIYWK